MAKFAFEGEIESLSPRQQEFLCEILEKRGYTDSKVQIENVGKVGDNYIANVKRITVHGNDGNTFKIIAKIAPTHEMARKLTSAPILFMNEITMYNEVLPKIAELQRAADVPESERLKQAECYGVLTEPPNELILLEDLQVSNFEMLDRFGTLSDESVRIVLKNFAILHSLAFVWKKKEPEVVDTYMQKLMNYYALMNTADEFKAYMTNLENDTLKILDSETYKKAIRNTISKLGELGAKAEKNLRTSRYSVFVQGDAWTNNLMFRLDEGKPVEAIMIDYQLSRLTSPVVDILYMIYICTDYVSRKTNFHDWMDYYHSELDRSLSNYGLKANYVYPKDQLDADLKRYSKLFFATSIMCLSVLIRSSEDAAKIKESFETGINSSELQASSLDPQSVATFKSKVEDLVRNLREFGYLEN